MSDSTIERDAARAEAVAARLVEVICEQEEIIAGERMLARAAMKVCNGLGQERDAARAEVRALRRDLRVERRINDEFVRWKADLRAKADECSTVGEVLALFDEAGQ